MNTLHEIIEKVAAIKLPSWAIGVTGFVLLLAAFKAGKGLLKLVLGVLALAAIAGAVWWHFHNQGKP